ncbi:SH3 domain-containing protein [Clostridium massiliamazoniense]|uniref:SH3 domain-containing protein n=1 Tax=Clostridium massiliamazoniense TaxID=1347366 RepID=UPI0006D76280|nr:SH3 domain-containing protein [Clostridium massiliamazoniense]
MKRKALIGLIAGATISSSVAVPLAMNGQNINAINNVLMSNNVNSSQTNEAVVINGNSKVNLYGLSNGKGIISKLSVGEMLTILGQQGTYCKVKVQETGTVGYINIANMQRIVNGTNATFRDLSKKGQVINVSTDVRLRKSPSINSEIIDRLSNGTNFTILGKQGQWYKISVNNKVGFIYEEYVSTVINNALLSNGSNGVAVININNNSITDSNSNNITNTNNNNSNSGSEESSTTSNSTTSNITNNTKNNSNTSSVNNNLVNKNSKNVIVQSKAKDVEKENNNHSNNSNVKSNNNSNSINYNIGAPSIGSSKNGVNLFMYFGDWKPTVKVGVDEDFVNNKKLSKEELDKNDLVFTHNLYSFKGVTIKNPKYYTVTYTTAGFFGGGYNYSAKLGKKISFIVAIPQNSTFDLNSVALSKCPFLANGQLFAFLGPEGDIYKFTKNDGISDKKVKAVQSKAVKVNAQIVNLEGGEKLPLYAKPSKESKILKELSNGDKISSIRLYSNGWTEITVENTTGFVQGPYVELCTTPQINGNNLNKPAKKNSKEINVVGEVVNLKKGYTLDLMTKPTSNSEAMGSFINGQKVTVLKNLGNGWLEVKYGQHTGYVDGTYIKY